jgi:ADP-ribose pyrophosphatase YjhB (NUDIX family)
MRFAVTASTVPLRGLPVKPRRGDPRDTCPVTSRPVISAASRPRIPCVGAVVFDPARRLLLVRRANPPAQGLWSIPGGRVEPGEHDEAAIVREVAEETGLAVAVRRLLGTVERDAPAGGVYVIADYACDLRDDDRTTDRAATPVAGDDASDVGWFTAADLRTLPTSPGLVAALASWDVLPD